MPLRPGTLAFDPRTGALLPAEQTIAGWDTPYYPAPVMMPSEEPAPEGQQPDYGPPPTAPDGSAPVDYGASQDGGSDYNTPVGELLRTGRLGGHPVAPEDIPPPEPPPPLAERAVGALQTGLGRAITGAQSVSGLLGASGETAAGLGAAAGLGVSVRSQEAMMEDARNAISRDMERNGGGLKGLLQAARAYQQTRPEAERVVNELLMDPLNLIGMGLERTVAEAVSGGVRSAGRGVERAGEAAGRAMADVGRGLEAVGPKGEVLGSFPEAVGRGEIAGAAGRKGKLSRLQEDIREADAVQAILGPEGTPTVPRDLLSAGELQAAAREGIPIPPGPEGAAQVREALAAKGGPEQGFAEQVRTAERTPPGLSEALEKNRITYEGARDTKLLSDAAQAAVDADLVAAQNKVLTTVDFRDTDVALANHVLDRLASEGRMEEAVAVAEHAGRALTEAGRTVQAASIWSNLTPEGKLVYAANVFRREVEKGRGAASLAQAHNLEQAVEIAALQAKNAALLKQLEGVRTRSTARLAKTVQEAVAQQAPIKYSDFLKGIRGVLLDSEAGAIRLMRTAEFELPPADAQRFFERAQSIRTLTSPADRSAAKEALLKEIEVFRAESVSAVNVDRKATRFLEQTAKRIEAQEVRAASVESRLEEIGRIEREEARADAALASGEARQTAGVESAVAREEQLRLRAEQKAALDAEKLQLQDEAAFYKQAELQQRSVKSLTAQRERTIARSTDSLAEQRAASEARQAGGRDYGLTDEQIRQRGLESSKSLEEQRQRTIANSAGSLSAQEARAYEAANLQAAEDIAYLTDAEYRAARKIIKNQEREGINAIRRTVRTNDLNLPPALADSFYQRSRAMQSMTEEEAYFAGKDIMRDIQSLVTPDKWDKAMAIYELPRAMKAGFDFSYALNQGIISGVAHPQLWAEMTRDMVKSAFDPAVAKALETDFLFDRYSKAMLEAGLEHIDPYGKLGHGEEYVMGRITDLPVVGRVLKPAEAVRKASERAFVAAGNKQRKDIFHAVVDGWLPKKLQGQTFETLDDLVEATGKTRQDFEHLASFLNATTGRGNIGKYLSSNNRWLNALFFAPRFFASRLEVPVLGVKYFVQNPALRKEVSKSIVGFTISSYATLTMLDQLPGVSVELDPRSSDFGDVRVGPVRINWLAGYSALITATARIGIAAANKTGLVNMATTKSSTGFYSQQGLSEGMLALLRSKLAPYPGLVWDLAEGQDPTGAPLRTKEQVLSRLMSEHLPFLVQDVAQAWKEAGPGWAGVAAPLSAFGGRLSAYSNTTDIRDRESMQQHGKLYREISQLQQAEIDKLPPVVAKQAEQEAKRQYDPRQVLDDARRAREEGLELLMHGQPETATQPYRPGLRQKIDAGLTGKALNETFKDFNAAVFQNSQTAYGKSARDLIDKREALNDKTVVELLRDQYWGAPVKEDDLGNLDFKGRDAIRASTLREAEDKGIALNMITEQKPKFNDSVIQTKWEEREKDMETLRPYWDIADIMLTGSPRFQSGKAAHDANPTQRNQAWDQFQEQLQEQRDDYFNKHREVRVAGAKWGLWQSDKMRPRRGR